MKDLLAAQRRAPKICIIAQNSYGALHGGLRGHIGGAERQTTMVAKWLAAQGYPTTLITWDEGQPDFETIDGVTVLKLCRSDAGLPGFRFFYPRTASLFSCLNRADADLYYHNSAEHVTGLVALWCRLNRKQFVYSVASDVACERTLPTLKRSHERTLYRYGLRHASKIIVQTGRQERLLRDTFGLDSVVLPMPCDISAAVTNGAKRLPSSPPRVAWVGRIDVMKRLDWLLDIADRLPGIQFDVVGATNDAPRNRLDDYSQQLCRRAKAMRNVVWHGTMPREKVAEIYNEATCLCCTSSYEGFPNTFLEAWSQGRPVVSSFDPDGIIQFRGLGAYVSEVEDFVTAIERLVNSSELWKKQSAACIEYYVCTHASDVAFPRFEQVLVETVAKTRTGFSELLSQRRPADLIK